MTTGLHRPDWAEVIAGNAAVEATSRRLIAQLRASEAAAIAFCRLLECWARGEPDPCTPGRRQSALRRAERWAATAPPADEFDGQGITDDDVPFDPGPRGF